MAAENTKQRGTQYPQLADSDIDTGKYDCSYITVYNPSKLGKYPFEFNELGDVDEYGSRIPLNSVSIPRWEALKGYEFD